MTQSALVTGASSGIGAAVSNALLDSGWEVYGIGRDFSACSLVHNPLFHACSMDLSDTERLLEYADRLPKDGFRLLVNNAGAAWYGPHETLSPSMIQTMTRTNLEVPMILCGRLLRTLRQNKGMIINIASVTALAASPHGAVYGALKAGLVHFSRTLFEENRKSGLRVSVILPDISDTGLYRNADFGPSDDPEAVLQPEDTAEAVMMLVNQREGTVISELVLRPQKHQIQRKNQNRQ